MGEVKGLREELEPAWQRHRAAFGGRHGTSVRRHSFDAGADAVLSVLAGQAGVIAGVLAEHAGEAAANIFVDDLKCCDMWRTPRDHAAHQAEAVVAAMVGGGR